MSVHQRMLEGDEKWYTEPPALLPRNLCSPDPKELGRNRARCVDDIHYLRAVEVMGRHDPSKAKTASVWIRRRELSFHSAADAVATVSLEDANMLQSALERGTLLAGHSRMVWEFAVATLHGFLMCSCQSRTHNHSKAGAMACCMWAECTAWPLLPSNGYCRQCSHSWITETGPSRGSSPRWQRTSIPGRARMVAACSRQSRVEPIHQCGLCDCARHAHR